MTVAEYNYERFAATKGDALFRSNAPVGEPAPDFEVTVLETGETARVGDWWAKDDLVIEFGSLT